MWDIVMTNIQRLMHHHGGVLCIAQCIAHGHRVCYTNE
jgi:hypothetical protein